jgi:hypothetical protein
MWDGWKEVAISLVKLPLMETSACSRDEREDRWFEWRVASRY